MILKSQSQPVGGFPRLWFACILRITVGAFFIFKAIRCKWGVRRTAGTLWRLQKFSVKHGTSKFMRMNNGIRMGLYIPAFPGKPFFRSCEAMCGHGSHITPVNAVISLTKKCDYSCAYCYQRYDAGDEMPEPVLLSAIQEMQDAGIALFVLEGGEPFLAYERLRSVCGKIDDRSEIWVNTTGAGVTRARLLELRKLGLTALKISVHHHTEAGHNAFLGSASAWVRMREAVELCQELGVPFAMNARMTPESFRNGDFEHMMHLGREWNAAYIQLLTPRSAGGYVGKPSISYSAQELNGLKDRISRYNRKRENREYPAIFFDEFDERCIVGCTAGAGRFYLNVQGEMQPCQHINVSFGNVRTIPVPVIIDAMKEFFSRPQFRTSCTLLAASVNKYFDAGDSLPLPIQKVRQEWKDALDLEKSPAGKES